MKRLLLAALALAPAAALAGSIGLLRVGAGGVVTSTAPLKAPVFTTFRLGTAAANLYGAGPGTWTGTEQNSVATTLTTRRVPVPFAATISRLHTNLMTAPAAATVYTVTDNITKFVSGSPSQADGTVTCPYPTGGATTNNSCFDNTHTDTVAAGNLIQWHFGISDSLTQASPGQLSWVLTATGGQYVALMNQANSSAFIGASGVAIFTPGGAGGFVSESTVSFQFCPSCGGTITGFFLVPNVTETGAHNWVVNKNGVATGMTFNTSSASTGGGAAGQCISPNGATDSIAGGTVANPCTSNAGLTFTVAPGDTLSVTGTCPGGTCATAVPGFSLIFAPTNPNTVPLSATASAAWGAARWVGANSYVHATTQTNFQQVPAAMTFSNYQFCTLTAPSTGTETTAFQTGATPGALPTTPAGTLTATFAVGVACPTNSTFLGGAVDTNLAHNVTVAADQTVNTAITATGTTGTQITKVSMAVTVP